MKYFRTLNVYAHCAFIFSITMLGACGSSSGTSSSSTTSSGTTSTSVATSTAAAIPAASGQVVSGTTVSAAVSGSFLKYQTSDDDTPDFDDFENDDPSQGIDLDDISSQEWTNKSFGACQMGNGLAQARVRMSEADFVNCIVSKTAYADINSTVTDGKDDGQWHHFAISVQESSAQEIGDLGGDDLGGDTPPGGDSGSGGEEGDEDGAPDSAWLKVVKDADDNVLEFYFIGCKDGNQNQYVSKVISPSTNAITINSDFAESFDFGTDTINIKDSLAAGCTAATVNGTLACVDTFDSDGDGVATSTPKTVTIKSEFDSASDSFEMDFTHQLQVKQTSKVWQMLIESSGSDSFGEETCEFTDNFFGIAGIYDANVDGAEWSIKNTGIGAGFGYGGMTGGCGTDKFGVKTHAMQWDASWNEVVLDSENPSPYKTLVDNRINAGVLGSLNDTDSFAFTETQDCGAATEGTLTVVESDISSCDNFNGMSHNNINCFDKLGDDLEGDELLTQGAGIDENATLTLDSCEGISGSDTPSTDKIDILCECFQATFEECELVQSNGCFGQETVQGCVDAINNVSDFDTEVSNN